MLGPAPFRRVAAIDHRISFQLLPYRVEVTFEGEALTRAFEARAVPTRQQVEPRATLHYDVRGRSPFLVREEGDRLASATHPSDVASLIAERSRARLLDHLWLGSWLAMRGGLARIGCRRVLLAGASGAGLTTLLLRLLWEGHAVEGDEIVLFRDGRAVSLPHHLSVRPASAVLLPELAAELAASPTVTGSDGAAVVAFSPEVAGYGWSLEVAPVDTAVVLRGDHKGEARRRPMSTVEALQALGARMVPGRRSPASVVRAWSALLSQADAYELHVGGVADTVGLLVEACS